MGARRQRTERDAELVDLVRLSVRDHFQRRKLVRQLEELADQIVVVSLLINVSWTGTSGHWW